MWARVVEVMLGCWLAISPFIFGHAADATLLWATDLACAALVATFALLSYCHPTRHAHLLTLVVALWLLAFGRLIVAQPPPPASENHIVVGLVLLLFAIVPNAAARPPRVWFRRTACGPTARALSTGGL